MLTSREFEILKMISEEHSTKEIADMLCIAIGTVEAHRKNLFKKFRVRNMAGLINMAYQHGYLKVRDLKDISIK